MGSAAQKKPRAEAPAAPQTAGTIADLRAELCEVATKAVKSNKSDEAIYHFIGAVILDHNAKTHHNQGAAAVSDAMDIALFSQLSRLVRKRFGNDHRGLWVTFADVHQEMNGLLSPHFKPLDLKTCLDYFRKLPWKS
jgi:hypothetical protein